MNKIILTIDDLFELPGAAIYRPEKYQPVDSVCIDSRLLTPNSLFVAVKGEKFEGHDFISEAINRKAAAVVINEKELGRFNDLPVPVLTVKDTTTALGELARIWRCKLSAKIIGITGSAGKTTTKEMLAAILGEKFKINKTIGNNNNHIGVPLTIFSTNLDHEILVLELGTNHFGEIANTANISQPDYGLITNIGNSHLEYLKNKKGVLEEKIALFNTVAAKGGTVFINNDDNLLSKTMFNHPKRVTFGFDSAVDIKGEIKEINDEGKPVVAVKYKDKGFSIVLPIQGEHNARNFLAAAAVALKLGLDKKDIAAGIARFKPIEKRLNVKKIKKTLLIDDTYNANPESMRYAIDLMCGFNNYNRKIAVLGDMFELGDQSAKLHTELFKIVKRDKIDLVITIGSMMKNLDSEIKKAHMEGAHFDERAELIKFLKGFDFSNAVVLVKGSRGMKMEEFAKVIEDKVHG